MPMSYDLQVAAWVKLAEAVNSLNQAADTSQEWLDGARHTLLLMCDHMQPDELVRDGQLSVPASIIASLDGWDVFETSENDQRIMGNDEAERFENDDDALDYVKARAASNEPGTRLHAAALTLHGVAFPGDE